MKVTVESYATLFNSITDANQKIDEAVAILKEAQIKAERLFMYDEGKFISKRE